LKVAFGSTPAVGPADGRGAKRKIQGQPLTASAINAGAIVSH
jgi:hypothetical protein